MDVCTCNMYWNVRVAACTEGRRHTAACDGYVIVGWQLEQKAKLDEIAERQREREKEIKAKVRARLVFVAACCWSTVSSTVSVDTVFQQHAAPDSWNMCVSVFASLDVRRPTFKSSHH